jgi:hypothetical protein
MLIISKKSAKSKKKSLNKMLLLYLIRRQLKIQEEKIKRVSLKIISQSSFIVMDKLEFQLMQRKKD